MFLIQYSTEKRLARGMTCDPGAARHEIKMFWYYLKLRKIKKLKIEIIPERFVVSEIDNNIWGLQNVRLNTMDPEKASTNT